MKIDNPVARLHEILQAGKRVERTQNCREAWKSLLGARYESELLAKLSLVMVLPQKIKDVLTESLDPSLWRTQHWENEVMSAFHNQNLNGGWHTFIDHVTNNAMGELLLLKTIVHVKGEFGALENDELVDFKDKINSVLNEVIESEINQSVKEQVCRYLRKIITAIEDYQIAGIEPIMDAINATVGNAAFNKEYRGFLAEDEIGGKIIKIISAVADSVSVVQGLPPVATAILNLMSGK